MQKEIEKMEEGTKNGLKAKMRRGEKILGTFFELGGAATVECLGLAGFHFFIIDTEHGPFDVESALDFVRAAELRKIAPLVRVKDATRSSILKMLDIGAQGLIIPCIRTVDEVQRLVEYGKYYPLGRRGFATTRVASFGFEPGLKNIEDWFDRTNAETLIIPQCETAECLENIEEIAAIEGVDGIFVGPYDLSVALGKPTQFDNPAYIAALSRILKACKDAGKFSFIYSGDEAETKRHFADGFDAVAFGMDAMFLVNACRALIGRIKP